MMSSKEKQKNDRNVGRILRENVASSKTCFPCYFMSQGRIHICHFTYITLHSYHTYGPNVGLIETFDNFSYHTTTIKREASQPYLF